VVKLLVLYTVYMLMKNKSLKKFKDLFTKTIIIF
jgi:hypothetical protein